MVWQRNVWYNIEVQIDMSHWTYINGNIVVSPMGRTQAERRYILETVLDHLPFVTDFDRNMNVYIIQKNGYNSSSSHTKFGEWGRL